MQEIANLQDIQTELPQYWKDFKNWAGITNKPKQKEQVNWWEHMNDSDDEVEPTDSDYSDTDTSDSDEEALTPAPTPAPI